jgi:pimeloyl-ACP methyl ester carboxylesterase
VDSLSLQPYVRARSLELERRPTESRISLSSQETLTRSVLFFLPPRCTDHDVSQFESQYLFGLLGGTPAEVPDVYASRSPINNASHITAPMLFLQGDEDKVVPPEQATIMAEKIIKNGGQAEIVIFKGEGHGFRRAENRKRAMELELGFYERTFGIVGSKE